MSILIFLIVVLVVLMLALYVVEILPVPGPAPMKRAVQALLVLAAILVILDRAALI